MARWQGKTEVTKDKMRITIDIEDYSIDDYQIDFRAEDCANIRELNLAARIRDAVDRILRYSRIGNKNLEPDARRSVSVASEMAA
jgi:hypothetical protein